MGIPHSGFIYSQGFHIDMVHMMYIIGKKNGIDALKTKVSKSYFGVGGCFQAENG